MADTSTSNVDPMTASIGGMVLAGGLFLIAVVSFAWMWLQSKEPPEIDYTASLPPIDIVESPSGGAKSGTSAASSDVASVLRRANEAFNTGHLLRGNGPGALDLYLEVLKKDPYHKEGLDGLDLVLDAMAKKADAALADYNMGEAERYIAAISVARPDYGVLVGLHDRLELAKSVKTLADKAARQLSAGKLAAPPGDNASETYRTILTYDPEHRAAKQGMHRIALALWSRAERAMATKDKEASEELLLQIAAVEPGFSKLEVLAKSVARMGDGETLEARVATADRAYDKGRLAPPDPRNAYDIYRRILKDYPNSAEARRGIMRVREQVVAEARDALQDDDVVKASAWLARARAAGVDREELSKLSGDIDYQRRLENARRGVFDELLTLKDVTPVRRIRPKFPRTDIEQGWVDVEFTINERGRVKDPVVRRQTGKGVFEDSALSAVRRWRFEPVLENGRPMPVRVVLRFTFQDEG
jgi:TonB family protein